MDRRVLIATSNAGGAHLRLSQALASGFEMVANGRVKPSTHDLFALDAHSMPHQLARMYAPSIRHAPTAYGILYHATNRPWSRWLMRRLQRSLLPTVRALLRDLDPSAILTTHPLVNGLLLDALEAEGRRIPVVAQVSDLVSIHVSWVDPRLDAYSVPTEQAKAAVLGYGADGSRVRVLGLPVDRAFARLPTSGQARRALGLQERRFTVLALGGAEGVGKLEMVVRALEEVARTEELQLIVVCGRNQRLRRQLERMRPRFPMQLHGFVETMPQLMAAADVVVTKGGSLTIAEGLAVGRPLIVTQTVPGQEEGNEWFVEQASAGFSAPDAPRLAAAVGRLAGDQALLDQMRQAALYLARPAAAEEVAKWVMALMGEHVPAAHLAPP